MAETVKCPRCNAEVEAGRKFCAYCGADVTLSQAPPRPEAEQTVEYKCPSCGSALVFSTDSGKLRCSSCENEYDVGTIKQYQNNKTEAEFKWDQSYTSALNETLPEMTSYIC